MTGGRGDGKILTLSARPVAPSFGPAFAVRADLLEQAHRVRVRLDIQLAMQPETKLTVGHQGGRRAMNTFSPRCRA